MNNKIIIEGIRIGESKINTNVAIIISMRRFVSLYIQVDGCEKLLDDSLQMLDRN